MEMSGALMVSGAMQGLALPHQIDRLQPIEGELSVSKRGNIMRYVDGQWTQAVAVFDSLFPFSEFILTSGGVTGRLGPTHAQLMTAYAGYGFPWIDNPEFFTSDEGIQKFIVPKTGTYTLEVRSPSAGTTSRRGATVTAHVDLEAEDELRIIVGQPGGTYSGYGATAIISKSLGCILVAGGPGNRSGSTSANANAVVNPLATIGQSTGGAGAVYGSSGNDTACASGGGSGFLGAGGKPSFPTTSVAAAPLNTTALGGSGRSGQGGFGGGGGGGSGTNSTAHGGGGGYTGGAAQARYAIGGPTVASFGGTSYALVDSRVRDVVAVLSTETTGRARIAVS